MGSRFFGLKLKVSTWLLQNLVFLSLVIYFQKPKGTSAHQARNFVSNIHYWLKFCSCLVWHMIYDSGTGTISWPKNTELLLYVGRKTIWRVCVPEMFQRTVSMLKEVIFWWMSVFWKKIHQQASQFCHIWY